MANEKQGGMPRDHPRRKHYAIVDNGDGTVDIYLCPCVTTCDTEVGVREYDLSFGVVRGIVPWDGLEEDIRARYEAWCCSARVVDF